MSSTARHVHSCRSTFAISPRFIRSDSRWIHSVCCRHSVPVLRRPGSRSSPCPAPPAMSTPVVRPLQLVPGSSDRIAGGFIVFVVGTLFLFSVDRDLGRVHVQHRPPCPLLSFDLCN